MYYMHGIYGTIWWYHLYNYIYVIPYTHYMYICISPLTPYIVPRNGSHDVISKHQRRRGWYHLWSSIHRWLYYELTPHLNQRIIMNFWIISIFFDFIRIKLLVESQSLWLKSRYSLVQPLLNPMKPLLNPHEKPLFSHEITIFFRSESPIAPIFVKGFAAPGAATRPFELRRHLRPGCRPETCSFDDLPLLHMVVFQS